MFTKIILIDAPGNISYVPEFTKVWDLSTSHLSVSDQAGIEHFPACITAATLCGGVFGQMVVVGNGHRNLSSNLEQDLLHLT